MRPDAEPKSRGILTRRYRVSPIFKALFISVAVEVAVLLLTLNAVASSMMRHSAAAPRPLGEDQLATLSLIFHFPSIAILAPLQLFFLAPLVQVALMTFILNLVFKARESARPR